MGAYIINIPDTVDRIIYVNVGPDSGRTYISSHRVEDLTPYTEPDLEAIRKEAYEEGYKKCLSLNNFGHLCVSCDKYEQGLADAWEAARKIAVNADHGGLTAEALREIFSVGTASIAHIFDDFSASEAIEKIRQYEQEKEEQITKGDIVLIKSTPEVEILVTYADEEYVSGIALTEVDGNCEIGDQYTNIRISNVEKTGKHYNIVSVLQKMKEADNG